MWCEKISCMSCENDLNVKKGLLVAIFGFFYGINGMASVQCEIVSCQSTTNILSLIIFQA